MRIPVLPLPGRRRSRAGLAIMVALSLGTIACTGPTRRTEAADPSAERSGETGSGNGRADGATLEWASCDETQLATLQCATLSVPLDPGDAAGATIELALARKPAGDQRRRIGSLLVNPGGPGASGVDLVPQLAGAMSSSVLDRFDLVGFDPRGVARSAPLRCIDDPAAANALDGDPDTQAEIDAVVQLQQDVLQNCLQRHGDLLVHLSTADAAHDLDAIRRAVGDDALTYLGFSYGTELGATYATLFPDRIRALVLDGAVGPDLSDDDLSETQAQGFERAFANFVAACRTDVRCAARPDALARYERVRTRVEKGPIPVGTPGERRELTIGDFQIGVISAMYDQSLWAYLARGLVAADEGDGATLLALADLYHERKPDGTYPNSADANVAIGCNDSTERATVEEAEAAAAAYRADAPLFGAQLGWSSLSCMGWPVTDEPNPTIATSTVAPILVVGTINDPATPYVWAEQLTEALSPAARLLTWEGEGHTAYLKSECVTEAVDTLLVDLTLPDDGTRCEAGPDSSRDAFAGIAPDLRDAFMTTSGLDEEKATCVAEQVAAKISATDLVALYTGELPSTLQATVSAAVQRCTGGG